jgi:hypothetical protein
MQASVCLGVLNQAWANTPHTALVAALDTYNFLIYELRTCREFNR